MKSICNLSTIRVFYLAYVAKSSGAFIFKNLPAFLDATSSKIQCNLINRSMMLFFIKISILMRQFVELLCYLCIVVLFNSCIIQ